MASPFQKQSQLRKATYAALILALFCLTLLHRKHILEPWGNGLDLREQALGEAELTGTVVNLTLTGSRGVALWMLWDSAQDMQKRGQWSELNLTVKAITKLQPHYTGPWQFHSWNLAYNVPAELVRVEDKYYYITRGMELLDEGHQKNRDNPDLRFSLGTYYQGRFGTATDEANTMRTLLQLSCIKLHDASQPNPNERDDRDPERLRRGGVVHRQRFQKFCTQHPHLVRRLRESLGCGTPEEVVQYLADHRDIPTYFPTEKSELKFPLLPRRTGANMPLTYAAEDTSLPDEFDNFTAARMWFTYAQGPLPPPRPLTQPRADELGQYRLPKIIPLTVVFRQYPARAASYHAEWLEKEGWFDHGWEVDEGKEKRWFADNVVVGGGRNWSGDAWAQARNLWDEFGERNGLLLTPAERTAREELAAAYRSGYGVAAGELDAQMHAEDLPPEMRPSFEAHRQLALYDRLRSSKATNFPHFHAQAHAQATKESVTARRLFFEARKQHLAGEDGQAADLFRQGFVYWKQVLDTHDDFRHDPQQQEESYKIQAEYLRRVRDAEGGRCRYLKPLLVLEDFLAQGVRPAGALLWLPPVQVVRAKEVGAPVVGPLAGRAKDGQPYISPEASTRAQRELDLYGSPAK